MRHSRELTLSIGAIGLLAGLFGCARDDSPEPARHVVMIVVDTLRADAVGCLGAGPNATPRIDAIAERGAVFECAQSPSTWTIPATVSLLSGMTPFEHGSMSRRIERIPDDVPLLADVLESEGFRTAAVVCNPIVSPDFAFDRGFQSYTHQKFGQAESAVDAALDWLESTDPREERLFLYVHLFDPHWPYSPAAPEAQRLAVSSSPIDETEQLALASGMMRGDADATRRLLDWSDWAHEAYAACVASSDREIGRLIDGLGRSGVLDDALIVITADHGEEFGEHGAIGHARQLHEETLHVPLIMAGPGVPAGRRIREAIPLRCVPATVFARLGVRPPSRGLGVDLLDESARSWIVEQDQIAALNLALWPDESGAFEITRHLIALRRGNRRLLWSFDEDFDSGVGRLIPLSPDLSEGEALAVDTEPVGAVLVDALRLEWHDARAAEEISDDASLAKRRATLRQLGYVEAAEER